MLDVERDAHNVPTTLKITKPPPSGLKHATHQHHFMAMNIIYFINGLIFEHLTGYT